MEICSLKSSQAISLSGSCPNIHASTEEETLCPLPQQKENLAALKKSWKWLSLPNSSRSPLSGRRFSWNTSRNRSKRSPVKMSPSPAASEHHPLVTTSRARALSTSAVAMDDVDGTTYSSVEDSFAEIKHQLVSAVLQDDKTSYTLLLQATLSQQDRYFSQKLHDLDQAIQDVKLMAYGRYCNTNECPNQLQLRNSHLSKRMTCNNHLPHHQPFKELDPNMTSHSETCIIVISDTEPVDDDDVFSSN